MASRTLLTKIICSSNLIVPKRGGCLGLSFLGFGDESFDRTRYFLSRQDFMESAVHETIEGPPSSYLTLGNSIGEWHGKTSRLTAQIYEELVQDYREFVSPKTPLQASARQVEVLVGNLALILARRLARSITQLNTLGDEISIDPSSIEWSINYQLELPKTTDESYGLLMSEEFGELIDYLSVCHHFGLANEVLVGMSGCQAAPESRASQVRLPPLNRGYMALQHLLSSYASNNSISIVSSYLGRVSEIWLSFMLKQPPSLLEVRPEREYRAATREVQLPKQTTSRQKAVFLLRVLAPFSLTEGVEETLEHATSIGFARSPSVIFTSNAFSRDDEFKASLARALPTTKYVVGQHGNNYGVSKLTEICPELNASDSFLSWGWSDDKKIIPFGQIKPLVKGRFPKAPKGVSLFLREDYRFLLQADMHEPNERYFWSVIELCQALNQLKISTKLRLKSTGSVNSAGYLSKSIEAMEFVSIAEDKKSMKQLVSSGMAIVFTYDSTGMLEMGTAGIPFLLFAPDGLGLVRQEFQANYDALRSAGLLSEDPAQAAQLISSWLSASRGQRKIQREAIQDFTKGIAHSPKHKLRALRKILKNANEHVVNSKLD